MGRMMGIIKEPKKETGQKRPTEKMAENKELKRLKLVGPGPKMAGLGKSGNLIIWTFSIKILTILEVIAKILTPIKLTFNF